jgi:hypothetical protein
MIKNYPPKLRKMLEENGRLKKLEETPREVLINDSLKALKELSEIFTDQEKKEILEVIELVNKGVEYQL